MELFVVSLYLQLLRLPREVVDAPSLEFLKVRLDGALSNLAYGRGVGLDDL